MDDDDEEIYGPASTNSQVKREDTAHNQYEPEVKDEAMDESDDEEEEDSDSDIDIITERAPGAAQPESTPQARPDTLKREHSKQPSVDQKPVKRQAGQRKESTAQQEGPRKPGSEYPEVHTSTLDVDANPVYPPAGKPVTELDFDVDLVDHEKPWRRPGSDQSDWFNYGFDEFTWATYCLKQKNLRGEKEVESAQMKMMLEGGMPGMPSASTLQQGQSQNQPGGQMGSGMPPMPGMPGMPEMTPDMMNQMMQQMMASGVDPSQMDLNMFAQQFGQMMGGPPPGGQGGYSGQMGMEGIGGVNQDGRNRNVGGNFQGRGRGRRW